MHFSCLKIKMTKSINKVIKGNRVCVKYVLTIFYPTDTSQSTFTCSKLATEICSELTIKPMTSF